MRNRRLICLLLIIQLLVTLPLFEASAYEPSTLRPGMKGEAVAKMQEALITLKYLKGPADGIFGTKTENAVRKFQRDNGLKVDGLAGTKTLTLLYKKAAEAEAAASSSSSSGSSSGSSSSGVFSGNYSTLKQGMKGTRVKILQRALKTLKYYKKTVDGKFGSATKKAVRSFQKAADLKVDGKAGKKTLKAIEKALASGGTSSSGSASSGSSSGDESDTQSSGNTANIPSIGSVKLLHWFNDIKPRLKNGQYLKLVDPATGLTWTLRLYSLGRHADAEPLTAQDTANMVEAFGGQNTWNQKAVYVKLPDGTWTIGSTHDMPHMSGSISNNNFNGHLCVHFLRDMSECQQNDPKYGVANQKTIRAFWKELTGITVE